MDVAQRFKQGLNTGQKSFSLLWQHKQLIIYLGIPALLGIAIELIVYNLFFFAPTNATLFIRGITMHILASFGWIRPIALLAVQMITLLATTFAAVALVRHTADILKKRKASIKKTVVSCLPLFNKIFVWAAIATAVLFLIVQVDLMIPTNAPAPCRTLSFLVGISARMAWSLFTLFIIPSIALDTHSLGTIIRNSPIVMKKVFVQYFGGIFWLCLIGLLGFVPFLLISTSNPLFISLSYIALAPLSFILATVHTILKTKLYLTSQTKK